MILLRIGIRIEHQRGLDQVPIGLCERRKSIKNKVVDIRINNLYMEAV